MTASVPCLRFNVGSDWPAPGIDIFQMNIDAQDAQDEQDEQDVMFRLFHIGCDPEKNAG